MTSQRTYEDIIDIGATCRCVGRHRLYVAISKDLNLRAVTSEPPLTDLRPYVFKVGSTSNNCHDRWKSMRENRKSHVADGVERFKEPAYAGAQDWKFLRCWDVNIDRYDDREFKKWLTLSPIGIHVQNIPEYRPVGLSHIQPGKGYVDLFTVSESYVRSLSCFLPNDPLNIQLLAVACDAIMALVGDYAKTVQ